MGLELSILFFWGFVRSFVGPLGTNRNLRNAKLLLMLPIGLFSLAAFANAWPRTSDYGVWQACPN